MKRQRVPGGLGANFNLTPMIDVIFQLIIFFLCVNQYQKAETTQEVSLPAAGSSHVKRPREEAARRLIVNVLLTGQALVAGAPVTPDELKTLLQSPTPDDPRPLEVWIRADRRLTYGAVEPFLVACADAGITKVDFKVVKKD